MTKALRESANESEADPNSVTSRVLPRGVEVYEISGAFFFGAAETFKDTLSQVARKPRVLILRMRNVSLLDSSGLRALRDIPRRSHAEGTLVLINEIHAAPDGAGPFAAQERAWR